MHPLFGYVEHWTIRRQGRHHETRSVSREFLPQRDREHSEEDQDDRPTSKQQLHQDRYGAWIPISRQTEEATRRCESFRFTFSLDVQTFIMIRMSEKKKENTSILTEDDSLFFLFNLILKETIRKRLFVLFYKAIKKFHRYFLSTSIAFWNFLWNFF